MVESDGQYILKAIKNGLDDLRRKIEHAEALLSQEMPANEKLATIHRLISQGMNRYNTEIHYAIHRLDGGNRT